MSGRGSLGAVLAQLLRSLRGSDRLAEAGAPAAIVKRGEPVAFPLVVAPSGRFLCDQKGRPFPILGDAGWGLAVGLTAAEQLVYLRDRLDRGVNSILLQALEHRFSSKKPPHNVAGDLPFTRRLDGDRYTGSPNGTTTASGGDGQFPADPYTRIEAEAPDFTSPAPRYWEALDATIETCAEQGVLVFLFPAYVGFAGGDQGWLAELVANDAGTGSGDFAGQPWADPARSKLWNYGAWLADRYRNASNIVWAHGGDHGNNPERGCAFTAAQKTAVSNVMAGIRSIPGQASKLHTGHWARPGLSTDVPLAAGAFDLQAVYVDATPSVHGRRGYALTPPMPVFEIESHYEGNPSGPGEPTRRLLWWSYLTSIGGAFFGRERLWQFGADWRAHLDTPGARDLARFNAFILGLPWQDLVPSGLDGMKDLVPAGGGSPLGQDHVAAAATPDGRLLVAYFPPARAARVTVDTTVMSGPARGRWFNPATAAYTDLAAAISNTGKHKFAPPGDNGSGFRDWVLVLEAP
jgi:hypothetical protein